MSDTESLTDNTEQPVDNTGKTETTQENPLLNSDEIVDGIRENKSSTDGQKIVAELNTILSAILLYGLERGTSLARTEIERAKYLLLFSLYEGEIDFRQPEIFPGERYNFQTEGLTNQCNELIDLVKVQINNVVSLTPDTLTREQAVPIALHLSEAVMWLSLEYRVQAAK